MNSLPEFNATPDGVLTEDMLAAFDQTGVIILRGFASAAACRELRERALAIVERDAPEAPASFFSTKSNVQLSDDYFENSAANISFFFEEEAGDASVDKADGKASLLNKMGHAMHDLDPVFDKFSRAPELANAAGSLGFTEPLIVQSMYIFKPPGIGGEVVCHQDSTYLFTEPESCIGFWFAIDEAAEGNGCMKFIPGGHKGPLRELNRRGQDGKLATQIIDETLFDETAALPAPAAPGDLVIFHGRAPHMSAANRSDKPRHAYTLHIVDGAAKWPPENWLQRPEDLPFRGF